MKGRRIKWNIREIAKKEMAERKRI